MNGWIVIGIIVVVVAVLLVALSIRVVVQYERGVLLRFGRVIGIREPGLRFLIPIVDRMARVSMRVVTMPIQSQGIITRDNVSVDISAVAYFRVVDAVKSVVAIENVRAAIDQIAQTTLRKVVGQHSLDQALADTDSINSDIRRILDMTTLEWGGGHPCRTQGHPATGKHETRHGQTSRGGAGKAREDNCSRG